MLAFDELRFYGETSLQSHASFAHGPRGPGSQPYPRTNRSQYAAISRSWNTPRFCQLVKADIVIGQTGTLPCPSCLRGSPIRTCDLGPISESIPPLLTVRGR